jgi:hypothetical protein
MLLQNILAIKETNVVIVVINALFKFAFPNIYLAFANSLSFIFLS